MLADLLTVAKVARFVVGDGLWLGRRRIRGSDVNFYKPFIDIFNLRIPGMSFGDVIRIVVEKM